MRFFDRDRSFFTRDKLQHAAGGALVATVSLALGWGPAWSAVFAFVIGATYELGQWDNARSVFVGRFPTGHGFGLLDLLADMLGAAVPIAIYCYLGWAPLPSHQHPFDPRGILPRDRIALTTTRSGAITSQRSVLSLPKPESAPPAVPLRSSP